MSTPAIVNFTIVPSPCRIALRMRAFHVEQSTFLAVQVSRNVFLVPGGGKNAHAGFAYIAQTDNSASLIVRPKD